ncbi:MAG: class I tRNA ligase family protein, partial [Phycisphaerae bacterium]|nr:class I tRNA ligase family protein [Phycisphaerae bacterium]
EFGTGCVKVTPAHDPNDYACGQRHKLAMINILTLDGRINDNGGAYEGMDRYTARDKVVKDLDKLGLLEKIEPYQNEVGHSDRSKTPIEPMLSEQWFVNINKLAEPALKAVRDGRVKFFPERYTKTYLDWLGEKRDWCISRQLWWGHRIPIWGRAFWPKGGGVQQPPQGGSSTDSYNWAKIQLKDFDGLKLTDEQREATHVHIWPCDSDQTVYLFVCVKPNRPEIVEALEADGFVQDPDVLDTWFSSALWPHSTFGWPDDNADVKYFYPSNVLCTARDIISLWVARMVMTGLYNLGKVPFPHVYIHSVIQDGKGRRMSKSAGNGVDPLDLIEMYGTDAMRFTLAQLAGETQDIRIPVKALKTDDGRSINTSERFELGRNFCNKLYQAATGFVMGNLEAYEPKPLRPEDLELEDRWILSRLGAAIADIDRRLDYYQFSDATNTLYTLFWSDFCDWYIELVKPRLFGRDENDNLVTHTDESANVARQVLVWVLDQLLRLLHPIAPFVTEAIWQRLNEAAPRRGLTTIETPCDALIVTSWPDSGAYTRDEAIEHEVDVLRDVIRALRDIRNRVNGIRAGAKETVLKTLPKAVLRAEPELAASLQAREAVILRLGQCDEVEIGPDAAKPPEAASVVLSGIEVYVSLSGLADLGLERKRLRKERDELASHITRLEGKLNNEGFIAKAPPEVVESERERLGDLKDKLAAVDRNLAEIGE